ncbi:MAG: hypothetical protein ABW168_03535 [Sedimenticola sp.]
MEIAEHNYRIKKAYVIDRCYIHSYCRTMTSRSAKYRKRLKEEHPEQYQLYLDKQKSLSKHKRDSLKKELMKKKPIADALDRKQNQLKLQRARQEKYVKNKKSTAHKDTLKVKWTGIGKGVTRRCINDKREYQRLAKRKQRATMTPQKKTWVRKKDRDRKAAVAKSINGAKIVKEVVNRIDDGVIEDDGVDGVMEDDGVDGGMEDDGDDGVIVERGVVDNDIVMEDDSVIVEQVVDDVVMEDNGINVGQASIDQLKQTKEGKIALKQLAKALKHKSQRYLARKLKLHRKTIRNSRLSVGIGNYKRRTKIDENSIKDFYIREDISRAMPQKRYTTKQGAGYLLQISLKAAHSKYITENPTKYVSLGKFSALRPKNVRLLCNNHREYCVCVYCVNVRYKMLTLSRAMKDTTKKRTNEIDINTILLCEKENMTAYHKRECISGECTKCADHLETLSQYYEDIPENLTLTWSRWERTLVHGRYKRIVITKSGNKTVLLKEFALQDIDKPAQGFSFVEHLHTAHWQIKQFNSIKNELPDGQTLQVMDFAKNRAVIYQDEIKSAFYTQEQITMHPIITYYNNSIGLQVKHSAVVISEDNTHDYHAVEHFQKVVNDKIETELHKKPTTKVIFSDGCSSQYKSKGPFADMSKHTDINRNYFGSEHGKAEGDAEIGQLNRAIDRAIIGNQVIINHAEDLYKYCQKHLQIDQNLVKREYFFVRNGEINRNRPETEIKGVPNSRKIHQIVSESPYTLMTRNLSCFCRSCKMGDYKSCCNKAYVNTYENRKLQCEHPDLINTNSGRGRGRRGEQQRPKRGRRVRTRGGRGVHRERPVSESSDDSEDRGEQRISDVKATPKRGRRVRSRGGRSGRRARRTSESSSPSASCDSLGAPSSPEVPGMPGSPPTSHIMGTPSSAEVPGSPPTSHIMGTPSAEVPGMPPASDIMNTLLFSVSDIPDTYSSAEYPEGLDFNELDTSVVSNILSQLEYM